MANSEMFFAGILPTGESGRGRCILPVSETPDDWEAKESLVQVLHYDAYAVSHTGRSIWGVHVVDLDGKFVNKVEVPARAYDPNKPQARYFDLAEQVEQHLGRTGLVILVS